MLTKKTKKKILNPPSELNTQLVSHAKERGSASPLIWFYLLDNSSEQKKSGNKTKKEK